MADEPPKVKKEKPRVEVRQNQETAVGARIPGTGEITPIKKGRKAAGPGSIVTIPSMPQIPPEPPKKKPERQIPPNETQTGKS